MAKAKRNTGAETIRADLFGTETMRAHGLGLPLGFSVRRVAALLDIPTSTMRRMIRRGDVGTIRVSSEERVPFSEVRRLLDGVRFPPPFSSVGRARVNPNA